MVIILKLGRDFETKGMSEWHHFWKSSLGSLRISV